MFKDFLRRGGMIAMIPLAVALVAVALWFRPPAPPGFQATDAVVTDGVLTDKVTLHRPQQIVTNGQVITRMITEHVITITYPVARAPQAEPEFWQIRQPVTPDYYASLAPRQLVPVLYDRANPNLAELRPDLDREPPAGAVWFILSMIVAGGTASAMIWRSMWAPVRAA